jgi:hypothetical protein
LLGNIHFLSIPSARLKVAHIAESVP